jgi:hypothetical protein
MFGLSDYLTAKLLWGLVLVVAGGIYGFWRGWKGLPLDKTPEEEDRAAQRRDHLDGPLL